LVIQRNGGIVTKKCEWVARRNTENRCGFPGVSAACPVTCDSPKTFVSVTTQPFLEKPS
jgi:hypothetical protein